MAKALRYQNNMTNRDNSTSIMPQIISAAKSAHSPRKISTMFPIQWHSLYLSALFLAAALSANNLYAQTALDVSFGESKSVPTDFPSGTYAGGTVAPGADLTNDGTITNTGNFFNNGTINNNNLIENNDSFVNQGTFNLGSSARLINYADANFLNSGTITNNGRILNQDDAIFSNSADLYNNFVINNDGSFLNPNATIINNATLNNSGTFSNTGTIENGAAGTFNNIGTLNNQGSITNDGILNNALGAEINISLGTLMNNKTLINGAFITNYTLLVNNDFFENNAHFWNLATFNNINTGTFTNTLNSDVRNMNTINNHGSFENSGSVTSVGNFNNFDILLNDGEFKNDMFFSNEGDVDNNGEFTNDYVVTNAGTFNNAAGSSFTNTASSIINNTDTFSNSGTLYNNGTFNNGAGSSFTNTATGIIYNGNGGSGASIAGDMTNDGNIIFNHSDNTAYQGALSGSGTLNKEGTGTLLLTGDSSTFTGTTTVLGGALIVGNGTDELGGDVIVNNNALLGGSGIIHGNTSIASSATHAPGNSIGVQYFSGDYTNNGTLLIEATPSAADQIVVNGAVDITGAILQLSLSPSTESSWVTINNPFIIIDNTGAGAVTGTFSDITKNLVFLDALVAYDGGDGNDVTLELTRNSAAFSSVGWTRNQVATGDAVDSLNTSNPIWNAVALLSSEAAARASYDQLSGEIHTSAKTAMLEDSRFLRDAVNNRMRAAFGSAGTDGETAVLYENGAPITVSANTHDAVMWGQAFGSWGHLNSDHNAARLNRSLGGFFIGADAAAFKTWRVGAVAGYSHSNFKAKSRASSGSSDNYHLGLYAGTEWQDFSLRTGASYTLHDLSTSRSIGFSNFSDSLKKDYKASTAQAFGEVAYSIKDHQFALEPFANLAYVNLHTDSFTEKGGAAALRSRSTNDGIAFSTLGMRGATDITLSDTKAKLNGMLGWRHALGGTTPLSTHMMAGGDTFTIAGVPLARDAAVLDFGLDFALSPASAVGISYGGQFGSDIVDQALSAKFNMKF